MGVRRMSQDVPCTTDTPSVSPRTGTERSPENELAHLPAMTMKDGINNIRGVQPRDSCFQFHDNGCQGLRSDLPIGSEESLRVDDGTMEGHTGESLLSADNRGRAGQSLRSDDGAGINPVGQMDGENIDAITSSVGRGVVEEGDARGHGSLQSQVETGHVNRLPRENEERINVGRGVPTERGQGVQSIEMGIGAMQVDEDRDWKTLRCGPQQVQHNPAGIQDDNGHPSDWRTLQTGGQQVVLHNPPGVVGDNGHRARTVGRDLERVSAGATAVRGNALIGGERPVRDTEAKLGPISKVDGQGREMEAGLYDATSSGGSSDASSRSMHHSVSQPALFSSSSSSHPTQSSLVRSVSSPSYPQQEYYDVCVIYHKKNESGYASEFRSFAERMRWKVTSTAELPIGVLHLKSFCKVMECCSYVVLLITDDFVRDNTCERFYNIAIEYSDKHEDFFECVLPVVFDNAELPPELYAITHTSWGSTYFENIMKKSVSLEKRLMRERDASARPLSPPIRARSVDTSSSQVQISSRRSSMSAGVPEYERYQGTAATLPPRVHKPEQEACLLPPDEESPTLPPIPVSDTTPPATHNQPPATTQGTTQDATGRASPHQQPSYQAADAPQGQRQAAIQQASMSAAGQPAVRPATPQELAQAVYQQQPGIAATRESSQAVYQQQLAVAATCKLPQTGYQQASVTGAEQGQMTADPRLSRPQLATRQQPDAAHELQQSMYQHASISGTAQLAGPHLATQHPANPYSPTHQPTASGQYAHPHAGFQQHAPPFVATQQPDMHYRPREPQFETPRWASQQHPPPVVATLPANYQLHPSPMGPHPVSPGATLSSAAFVGSFHPPPQPCQDYSLMSGEQIFRQLTEDFSPGEAAATMLSSHRFSVICERLDPPDPRGFDWSFLAEVVELSPSQIRILQQNPTGATKKILEIYFLMHSGKDKVEILEELARTLKNIDRYDVAEVVDRELLVTKCRRK